MQPLKEKLLHEPIIEKLKKVENLPSKWQTDRTVYDHTMSVVSLSEKMYPDSKVYLVCSFLHDIGKSLTREINKSGLVIFPGHPDVSKTLASPIIDDLVKEGCLTSHDADDCLFIIEHHMRAQGSGHPWTEKAIGRFMQKMGKRLAMLLKFTDIDIRSRGVFIPKDGEWTKEIALVYDAIAKLNGLKED